MQYAQDLLSPSSVSETCFLCLPVPPMGHKWPYREGLYLVEV